MKIIYSLAKLRPRSLLVTGLLFLFGFSHIKAQPLQDFTDELYHDGWNQVVGLTYDEDGTMYVWEKGGKVFLVKDSLRFSNPLIDISDEVGNWGAHGMLGFALHPHYFDNGYIFMLYAVDRHHMLYAGTPSYSPSADAYQDATIGRIARYTVINPRDPNNAYVDLSSRKVLVGETPGTGFPITANTHGVGSLVFGTDHSLLATCGDGAFPSGDDRGSRPGSWYQQALEDGILNDTTNCGAFRSQSFYSLSGKLLRIDPETGAGYPSNPYYDVNDPFSVASRIWALGFRQPFRTVVIENSGGHEPAEGNPGIVIIGDVGAGNREELNVCDAPGLNFGWPLYEGMERNVSYSSIPVSNLAAPTPGGCGQDFYTYDDLLYHGFGTPTFPDPCNPGSQIASTYPIMAHTRPRMAYRGTIPPQVTKGGAIYEIGSPQFAGNTFNGSCILAGFMYTGQDYPEHMQNSFFLGEYEQGWIRRIKMNNNFEVDSIFEFADIPGTIVGLYPPAPGKKGLIYINFENELRKIRYVGDNNRTPLAALSQDTAYSPSSSLTVQFDGSSSTDFETAPLSYNWNFGDGTTGSGATPSHTFTATGSIPETFTVTLTVTDTGGLSNIATTEVFLNNTPPQILSTSLDGFDFYSIKEETLLDLTAQVSDNEHAVSAIHYIWQGFLYHDDHNHPEPKVFADTTTFTITPYGCEEYAVYWYVIELTLSDPEGLSTKMVKEIHPNCDLPVAKNDESEFVSGYFVEVDVAYNDLIYDGLDPTTVSVLTPPKHGTAIPNATTGTIRYTHDGSASMIDSFAYVLADVDGDLADPAWVYLTGQPSPILTLTSPSNGTTLEDNRVEVSYTLGGNTAPVTGVNFKVNGSLVATDNSLGGTYRLVNLPSGTVNISAILVDANGNELDIPSATDSVSVNLQALGSTFSYKIDISIQANEVMGSTPHANFPFNLQHTANELRHTSHGGWVEHIAGRDIAFRLADGTILDHELEKYNPTTGEVIAWIRIPSLSTGTNTELELVFGSQGFDQVLSSPYAWSNDYVARWHMNPTFTGSVLDMKDGTANDNDGSSTGGMSQANIVPGLVGDAVSFDGSDDYFTMGNLASAGENFTLSAWVQADPNNPSTHGVVGNYGFGACCGNRAPNITIRQATRVRAGFSGAGNYNRLTSPYNLIDTDGSTWNLISLIYDGTDLKILVDGEVRTSSTDFAGQTPASTPVSEIGKVENYFYTGAIDEVSLSDIAHSTDWVRTEYRNLTNPNAFYVVSSTVESNQSIGVLSLSPSHITLGTNGDTIPSQSVEVRNTGNAEISQVNLSTGTADFTVVPHVINSLGSGQATNVTVSFVGTSGPKFDSLMAIAADSGIVSRGISLAGDILMDSAAVSATDLNFQAEIGADDTRILYVINAGNGTLDSANFGLAGTDAGLFSINPAGGSNLAAGDSIPVTIQFSPLVEGSYTATFTIDTLPFTNLSGTGTPIDTTATDTPLLVASVANLSFQATTGDTAEQSFFLINEGTGELASASLAMGGADAGLFEVTPLSVINLAAGDSIPVHIQFLPTAVGGFNATFAVNGNDLATLSGTATAPVDTTPPIVDSAVVLYRIDAGGVGQVAVDGGIPWDKDARWDPTPYLASDYLVHRTRRVTKTGYTSEVDQSTTNLEIFYYDRWDRTSEEDMAYSFPVAEAGDYLVRLYLCESEATHTAGSRIFSVLVEGQALPALTDIDLAAEVGVLIGTVKSVVVPVTDGSLDIEFLHNVFNPLINGIEILTIVSDTVSPPPTGTPQPVASVSNLNFQAPVDDTASQTLYLINSGDGAMEQASLGLTGTHANLFSLSPLSIANLPAGDSLPITIQFLPTTAGSFTAAFAVDGQNMTDLAGTATAPPDTTPVGTPQPVASVANLAFTATTGAADIQTLYLINAGNAPLPNAALGLGGTDAGLFVMNPLSVSNLAAGDSIPVEIQFLPTAAGSFSATFTLDAQSLTSLTGTATAPPDSTPTPPTDSAVVLYRIDAGGVGQPAIDGGIPWDRDSRWDPTPYLASDYLVHRTRRNNKTGYTSAVDQGTTNLEIFYYDRWDRASEETMKYSFPVSEPGEYMIRFYMAESEPTNGAGSRVFSINVEGNIPVELANIDIFQEAGSLVGTMKSVVQSVTDGSIDIEFIGIVSNPLVNGIEILKPVNGTYVPQADPKLSAADLRFHAPVNGTQMQELYLTNEGDTTLEHADLVVTGADSTHFVVIPSHLHYTHPDDSILVRVYFSPLFEGNFQGTLDVGPHYSAEPRVNIPVSGVSYYTEPSLKQVFDWQLGANAVQTGDDDEFSVIIHDDPGVRASLLGDEVAAGSFVAVDTLAAVTLEPLAFFGPLTSGQLVDVSWHPWGDSSSRTSVLRIDQTPPIAPFAPVGDGSMAFVPGSQAFGFTAQWPGTGNALVYSLDSLNSSSMKKVRTYPLPGTPNAYLLAVEAGNAEGYQDLVFIARNLTPGIGDTATGGPTDPPSSEGDSAVVIYRMNAGGAVVPAIDGGLAWERDTRGNPSPYLVSNPGDHRTWQYTKNGYDATIDQTTTNLAIYDYERWDKTGGDNIQYSFPVALAGDYEVRFYLAESDPTATPGFRTFSIAVEGQTPANLSNIDLAAEVGTLVGTVKNYTATIGDGAIDIEFVHGSAHIPLVNGIEILRKVPSNARISELTTSAQAPQVFLQPNPVSREGKILAELELNEPSKITTRVFNQMGRLLKSEIANPLGTSVRQSLSFADLPVGIYLVQFEGNGWLVTKRVQVTD